MSGTDAVDFDPLMEGVCNTRGDALLDAIVKSLARTTRAAQALIGEADDESSVHTLAACTAGATQPAFRYALDGADCRQVLDGEIVWREVATADGQAYFGLPLRGSEDTVLGHLCARDPHRLELSAQGRRWCEMLATLAATELQRRFAESQLEELLRRQMLLEARNRQLEDDLKLLEREQVAAVATGTHRALPSAPLDLDSVATGLHHVQREHILRVLDATRWVIEGNSGAALKLGMKPATLRHRMKKLGISRELRARPEDTAGS